jgi:uncharacterized protein (TIGR03118 family)
MRTHRLFRSLALGGILLAAPSAAPADVLYHQTNIVSDGTVPATFIDPNLKDPWGIALSTGSPFWVSNQASNFQNAATGASSPVATLYSVNGDPTKGPVNTFAPVSLIVNVPNQGNAPADPTANGPTGQVSTGAAGITTSATDFPVVGINGGAAHKASFIFANQDGSISAWAGQNAGTPLANTTATIQPTAVVPGASFTGLAIANNPAAATNGGSGAQIYAADQNSSNIYIFSSSWKMVGTFSDPKLPAGYTAFNVQNIGGLLYVTYANQGNPLGGIVDVFRPDGTMQGRLIDNSNATTPHGNLDQPWGLALAPAGWGKFGGDLLVGNNGGDNWINAYNPNTGAFAGSLTLDNGSFFREGNLWALTFGNGASGGDPNTLYFTAGLNAAGTEGLFGSISAVPEPSVPTLLTISGGILAAAHYLRKKVWGRSAPAL